MTVVFGWDVSTSIIGVCAIDLATRGTIMFRTIDLTRCKTMYEKYDAARIGMKEALAEVESTGRIHYVEDRLMGFTRGMTNQQTLMKLGMMNAVFSCALNDTDPGVVRHIPPVTAKRIIGLVVPKGADKKMVAADFVKSKVPMFDRRLTKGGNLAVGVGDQADAWLLAMSGVLLESGEASLGPGKEAKRRERRPRRTEDGEGT